MNVLDYSEAYPKMWDEILVSIDDIAYAGKYIDWRINPNTIPEGKYMYQCRHDDEGGGFPVTIEEHVWVNFHGTFITDKPIIWPDEKDHCIILK